MSDAIFEDPTNEERPFVDAVCARPADLDARLVFADWLEERDDPRAEWLRAGVDVERAIEGLGWGFAFRLWRPIARKLLAHDKRACRAFDTCAAREMPHWLAYPAIIRMTTSGRWYCGGFLENVAIGRPGLKEHGYALRRCIPLRGVDSMGGHAEYERFDRTDPDLWKGIERIVDLENRRIQGFSPFWQLVRSRAFAEATHDVRALATGPLFQPEPLAAFLNAKPIQSLYLELHSRIADRQLRRLFDLWQPEDLRCLALVGLPEHTLVYAALAEWPGLASVRLLDLANSSPGERARRALADSMYSHPNLCVACRFSSERSLRPQEEGIVWFDSRESELGQASPFLVYG